MLGHLSHHIPVFCECPASSEVLGWRASNFCTHLRSCYVTTSCISDAISQIQITTRLHILNNTSHLFSMDHNAHTTSFWASLDLQEKRVELGCCEKNNRLVTHCFESLTYSTNFQGNLTVLGTFCTLNSMTQHNFHEKYTYCGNTIETKLHFGSLEMLRTVSLWFRNIS